MRKYIILLGLSLVMLACSKEDNELKPIDANITYGEMTDGRDGNVYKTIQVGDQVWMAENLRYRLPTGSLSGCYTFGEATINWALLVIDKPAFIDSVNRAIAKGEIVNPPGLPTAQQPITIINNFIKLNTPSQLMNRLIAHPAVVSVINRINENLKVPASVALAKTNLAAAEAQNGGYAKQYGFLYAQKALEGAAPEGWRIPTDEDWKKLESAVGMSAVELEKLNTWRGKIGNRLLEDTNENIGFNAKLAGTRAYGSFLYGTPYINRAVSGYYWTSTMVQESDSTKLSIVRQFMRNNKAVWRGTSKPEAAYHLKCIKIN